MLDPVIHKMITYVQNLEEKDLKDKVGLSICHSFNSILLSRSHNLIVPHFVLFISASGEHPRPAVSHQAAVYEVPEGTGYCGGWPAAWHAAAHAQDPPLFYQDELP